MKYLLTLFLSFVALFSFAQVDQADSASISTAGKQGTEMARLLLAKDYTAFAKFTYPPVKKMAGSEEKLIELLKSSIANLESQGISIINCSVENPEKIIHFKNTLQCTLIQNIEMKVPNGRMMAKSALIGISANNGKNWTFVDTHGSDLKTLQKNIPGLSNSLNIPEKQEPVFIKE